MAWAEFSGFPGKIRYHYQTPDGGPPNLGKPPSPPDQNTFDPYGFGSGGGFGFGGMGFGGMGFGGMPGCPNFPHQCGYPPGLVPQPPPGWYKTEAPPEPSQQQSTNFSGTSTSTGIPMPPAPPPYEQFNDSGRQPPFTGNRVKEQLAKFPDNKMGYIFPKHNAVVHIFHENIMNKYHPVNGVVTIPNYSRSDFSVQAVPCEMTFAEFIEQIDCKKRANAHPPYTQEGYPEHLIGIQELLEQGDGNFVLGTRIMLTDIRAQSKIGQLWSDAVGTAGQVKPRYVVRCPV